MCNVLGDYLLTYDLQYAEAHSDSSDFEGNSSPPVTPKNGSHRLIKKKLFSKSKKNLTLQPCSTRAYPASDGSSKEMWESQTIVSQNGEEIDLEVHQSYQNRKSKTLDGGDQIETIKSKRSLIRHKVIPCLSSIFGRSGNNTKQMSIITENQAEHVNIDNSCQATRVNCEHKIRKFNRRQQCYAVQPVYAVDGNVHAKSSPFERTKIVQEPLSPRKIVGNEISNNINYSLTSSSEAIETKRLLKKKKNKDKSKHAREPDMEKEYLEHYEGSKVKHRDQQCPSKLSRKDPYKVYTNPCQYQRTNAGCSPIGSNGKYSGSELPSTCSGFWDYLFNKINMKYQAQAALFKPCKCNDSLEESSRCCPTTCENTAQSLSCQVTQPCYVPPCPATRQESCSCSTSHPQVSPLNQNDNFQQRPSPTMPPFKTKSPLEKVECKCPKKRPLPPPLSQATSPTMPGPNNMVPMHTTEQSRPCQLTHEEITGALTQKYKGEILCIHNPPCVLINGCLNLPPPKEELTMNMWPVTQGNKSGYQIYNQKCSRKQQSAQYVLPLPERRPSPIMDVSCQYFPPVKEVEHTKINHESCQYQLPSMELKRMLIIDEGCQYQYSPLENRKQQVTANESCQYRPSPFEVHKQIACASECCQYSLSPTEIQQETPTKESYENLHPTVEVRQIKAPPKKEKIIQSICNHNPPCEVIRTCCKTKFDPKLQNSCVHVPMCDKIPLCLMELKNQTTSSCQHKPKCAEVPICTRNYIVLTAKEEVATQVRPKAKMVCRHEPPCIMIPKCLARICDSYVPYDAIPDCVHMPMCEMIPACCRKSAKEMVSVCSQYPNQCSIV